ncbi:MAG: hypothetical protein ACREDM_10265 [Methylocella sp.]
MAGIGAPHSPGKLAKGISAQICVLLTFTRQTARKQWFRRAMHRSGGAEVFSA